MRTSIDDNRTIPTIPFDINYSDNFNSELSSFLEL